MKVQIFQGKDKQWYWRFVAPNGRTLCVSEGYARRQSAKKSAWRCVLYAANGRVKW